MIAKKTVMISIFHKQLDFLQSIAKPYNPALIALIVSISQLSIFHGVIL
jgi:hypothetical protein